MKKLFKKKNVENKNDQNPVKESLSAHKILRYYMNFIYISMIAFFPFIYFVQTENNDTLTMIFFLTVVGYVVFGIPILLVLLLTTMYESSIKDPKDPNNP